MGNKIKGDATVSEDSAFRYGSFSINDKKIEVPLQALDIRKYYASEIRFNKLKIDVCEAYKIYNKEKLQVLKTFPKRSAYEERQLNIWKRDTGDNSSIKFLFIRFEGRQYPNDEEIKALIRDSYSFSDATPIPTFPDIFKEERVRTNKKGQLVKETKDIVSDQKLKKYFSLLEKYIELLNDWNYKDCLGAIPINIGTPNIIKLIDFYYNKNIHHFYLDLNTAAFNRLIDSPLMYGILAELKRVGLEYQKTFFYSINGSHGRFGKDNFVVSGKDILTGGVGLDCVGRLHLGGGNNEKITDPRVIEKLKLNRIRLFNKEDYGYYRLSAKKLPFKLPKDNIINENLFLDLNKGPMFSNIFNMQQLILENINLRTYIKEGFKPLSKIEKEKKKVSKPDLKSIQRFRTQKINSLL